MTTGMAWTGQIIFLALMTVKSNGRNPVHIMRPEQMIRMTLMTAKVKMIHLQLGPVPEPVRNFVCKA